MAATTPIDSLSLFPLHGVLLPGASLGLRVFEPRYLDLVRECGRNGRGFGICLIIDGGQAGAPATSASYGTHAVIEDFGIGADGLLTLRVRGLRRFHVERVRVRDNGLQVADVQWCPSDEIRPVQPEHGLLVTLLQGLLDRFGGEHAAATRAQLDDESWVGWRLAELLPLDHAQRQQLLQLDDGYQRLERLLTLLP